jgi:glycerol-3-phosphate acyltransferase PlsY
MISSYLVIEYFLHQVLEILQFDASDPSAYAEVQKTRYNLLNMTPLITLNNDYTYETNIWVCFSIDALEIVLLLICTGVLITILYVIDRYYNSNYIITRKVEPLCSPWLFNPWGQSYLGLVMVVIGCATGAVRHGTNRDNWFFGYAPVWAGIAPTITGVFAALSLKSCDIRPRRLPWVGLIMEIISLITSVVALILIIIVLIDNISSLLGVNGFVMVVTETGRNQITASSLFCSLAAIIIIVNIFYSISLLFRIFACLCTKWYRSRDDEQKYVLGETSDNETTTVVEKTVTTNDVTPTPITTNVVNITDQPASVFASPRGPFGATRFDPYRPMGTRPFYLQ